MLNSLTIYLYAELKRQILLPRIIWGRPHPFQLYFLILFYQILLITGLKVDPGKIIFYTQPFGD
jgi:hypothetical protein